MERIPEPELMDDPAQAAAYAGADCSAAHDAFVARFRAAFPTHRPHRVLDLGCGNADVTVRFARAWPQAEIIGVDAASAMLDCAHDAVNIAGFGRRISFVRSRVGEFFPARRFGTIISNSLLHHLADCAELWQGVMRCAAPGATVFVMDLRRPPSPVAAAALVEAEAGAEPELFRRDFLASLLAAYEPDEVRAQLVKVGLDRQLQVEAVGDRHLMIRGRVS